ncbi:MAG: DUF3995 domain-containing protein [Bacteroidota bacterium]
MVDLAGLLLCVSLLVVSSIHVYWAFGGRWGGQHVVPTDPASATPTFTPSRTATLAVALALGIAACVVMLYLGWFTVPLPTTLVSVGMWGLTIVLIARTVGDFKYAGLSKRVKTTPFARLDTRIYTPLCGVLGLLALLVVVFGPG